MIYQKSLFRHFWLPLYVTEDTIKKDYKISAVVLISAYGLDLKQAIYIFTFTKVNFNF